MAKFYITTTIPYVNAEPHIGLALEEIQADVIARFHRLLGDDVIYNFGTDEHGLKIYQKALELKKTPQEYCDEYAIKFRALKEALNLSYTNFIRTTDPHHVKAAQHFWEICMKKGDIYKKLYKIKYCVGCELEKTDSELEEGKCPLHPKQDIQVYEEENYFFKFSRYQEALLALYKENPQFIIPASKLNEIKTFVEKGLQDFSISRLKEKMPWGIDVPGDEKHVMYVWFDALINYISTIGWPNDMQKFNQYWPVTQFAGKDQVRQQAAMWQAMLLSADLPHSKQIFIHGFLTVDGQKISKSLGNTIDPIEVTEQYGTDTLRYYLLAKIHPSEDSDFSWEKFKQAYNADLANGIGNLISRVARLAENANYATNKIENQDTYFHSENSYTKALEEFRFPDAIGVVWQHITDLDKFINNEKPWELAKTNPEKLTNVLDHCTKEIQHIAMLLQPFMPETAEKILKQFTASQITSNKPLFPRVS